MRISAELVKMGDPAARASELMKKADKKLNSFGFFGGSKYDDAAEMYERAGNQFKLAKACEFTTQTYAFASVRMVCIGKRII